MGLWQSKQDKSQPQPKPQVESESEGIVDETQPLVQPLTRWRYAPVFWATPVFVYNRTLPSDGHSYIPVHPVEPFRAQQYAVQK